MSDILDPQQFQEDTQDILAGRVRRRPIEQIAPVQTEQRFNSEGIPFRPITPSYGATAVDRYQMRQMFEHSLNPEEDVQRAETAFYLSQRTPYSPEYIFRNLEKVSEEFFGNVYKRNTLDIFKVAYHNTKIDIEIGKMMFDALRSNDPRSFLDDAARLEQRKVPENSQDYRIGQQIIEATAQIMPYIVNPIVEIAPYVGAGAAIGALAASGAGAPAALKAAGAAARTIRSAGSFTSITRVTTGLSFYQMLEAEDEDGNQIPLDIARGHALWSGVLQGAIGAVQLSTLMGAAPLKSMWANAVHTTAKNAYLAGRPASIAVGFLKSYGGVLASSTIEEVMQESVGYWMHQSAITLANQTTAANIPQGTTDEFLTLVAETARRTAMGLSIISIPGGARANWNNIRTQAEAGAVVRNIENVVGKNNVTPELINSIADGDMESVQRQVMQIQLENPRSQDIGLQKQENGQYVAMNADQPIMRFTINEQDGVATFSTETIEGVFETEAQQEATIYNAVDSMITRYAQDNPDIVIDFDRDDANQIALMEGIENLDPQMRVINNAIRNESAYIRMVESEIQAAQAEVSRIQEAVITDQMTDEEIAAQQQEVSAMQESQQQLINDLSDEILTHESLLQRAIDFKAVYESRLFERQDLANQPPENIVVADQQKTNTTPDTNQTLKQYFAKEFTPQGITEGEIDMMMLLLEMEAERRDMTVDQLMDSEYGGLSIIAGAAVDADYASRGIPNPASTVFQDSQRIMQFSKRATFSDFFHEWVHLSVENLNESQLQVLAEWTGQENTQWQTWTTEAHEQVVSGVFQVVQGSTEFTGRLSQVLNYIKTKFMKAAELLLNTKEINPEVENVLRSIIAEPPTQIVTDVSPEAPTAVVSDISIEQRLTPELALERLTRSTDAFNQRMDQLRQEQSNQNQDVLTVIENNGLDIIQPDGTVTYTDVFDFARQNNMTVSQAVEALQTVVNKSTDMSSNASLASKQKTLESLQKVMIEDSLELFAPVQQSLQEQRQRISEGIERFDAISDAQLQKYRNDPEIGERVSQEIQRREAENTLINEKIEEYRDMIEGMGKTEIENFLVFMEGEGSRGIAGRLWSELNVKDINQGNNLWAASVTQSDILRIGEAIRANVIDLRGPLVETYSTQNTAHEKRIRTWIRNNATQLRRALAYDIPLFEARNVLAEAEIDVAALVQLNREIFRTDTRDLSLLTKPYKMDVDTLQRTLGEEFSRAIAEDGSIRVTDEYLESVQKEASRRLTSLDTELTQELQRIQGFINNIRSTVPRSFSVKDPAADFYALMIKLQRNLQDGGRLDLSIKQAGRLLADRIQQDTGQILDLTKMNRLLTQRIENQKRHEIIRKERNQMRKMVRSMQRAANFNSIHINQRKEIEALVAGIDPEFRTKKTEARLREISEQISTDEISVFDLDARTRNMLGKENLNQFSFEQIQQIYDRVQILTDQGREAMRQQREIMESNRTRVIQALTNSLATDVTPPPIRPPEPGTRATKNWWQSMGDVYRSTLDIARLTDMLDGRKGFRGRNHNFFVTQVQNAEANMYRAIRQRETWLTERLQKLGYDVKQNNYARVLTDMLAKDTDVNGETFMIDGVTYSLDAVLEMYAGFKNPKKHGSIVTGNGRDRIISIMEQQNITERAAIEIVNNEFQGLIDRLSPEQKALADLIIDEYAENYDRIAETYAFYHNNNLGSEQDYTPIVVRGFTSLKHEAQMAKEILVKHNYRRAGLDRKFTIDRLENIPLNARRPLELGLFRNWEQSSLAQENFIAYSQWNFLANGIFSTSHVGEDYRNKIVQQRSDGEAMFNQLRDYHRRVLTHQQLLENTPINKVLSGLRMRTSQAYLAFNAITVMKQVPSLAFYLVEAGPTDIMTSLGKYIHNPGEFINMTTDRNPIPRQANREFAMIENYIRDPNINIGKRQLTEMGMSMIKIVDNAVTRIGEDAVYTKALRDGMTPQQAIELARAVTLRTQPAGRPKDMSKIFNIESLYLLTQFSQQLNKVWQMSTYDIPLGYNADGYRRQMLHTTIAMMISSYFIWAMNNRQVLPDVEDPNDFIDIMLTQTLSSVPIVGSAITQARQGFTAEPAIITPVTRAVDLSRQIQRAMDPERELTPAQQQRLMRTLLESAALGLGLPAVAPSRIIKAADEYFRDGASFTDTLSTALTGGVWTMTGEED